MDSPLDDYERMIRPIEQQMMRSVWRITQHADDADDALQDAIARIWERLPQIRAHPNPTALILRICCNAACETVRRRARRSKGSQFTDTAEINSTAPDAVGSMADREQQAQLTDAIARLPEQQAAAVTMRFLMSCTYGQIAQALDCAEPTARVHVARGLGRLCELLAHFNPATSLEEGT